VHTKAGDIGASRAVCKRSSPCPVRTGAVRMATEQGDFQVVFETARLAAYDRLAEAWSLARTGKRLRRVPPALKSPRLVSWLRGWLRETGRR
jgi:hypothetical protein